jgi:hypothetical protein
MRVGRKLSGRPFGIERARVDMDGGPAHVLGAERPSDLDRVDPRPGPCAAERPRQHAAARRAPDLVGIKPGRLGGGADDRRRFRQVRAERDQEGPRGGAVGPRARLHDGQVAGRNLPHRRTDPFGFERPVMWPRPLGDEDGRLVAGPARRVGQRRLRAALDRAGIDHLCVLGAQAGEKPRLGSASKQIVADHVDAGMLADDRRGHSTSPNGSVGGAAPSGCSACSSSISPNSTSPIASVARFGSPLQNTNRF